MASGTSGRGDVLDASQNLRSGSADEADVQCIWQSLGGMPIESNPVAEGVLQHVPEEIAQLLYGFHAQPRLGYCARGAQADAEQDIFSSGAAAQFVACAVDQCFQSDMFAHEEGP